MEDTQVFFKLNSRFLALLLKIFEKRRKGGGARGSAGCNVNFGQRGMTYPSFRVIFTSDFYLVQLMKLLEFRWEREGGGVGGGQASNSTISRLLNFVM